jgi:type IV pilus assembly protein PilY1
MIKPLCLTQEAHMKFKILLIAICLSISSGASGWASQDSYIGDTVIYGGTTTTVDPNVLIIFDSSGSMDNDVVIDECSVDIDGDGEDDVTSGEYDSEIDYTEFTSEEYCYDVSTSSSIACEKDTVYESTKIYISKRDYTYALVEVVNDYTTLDDSCSDIEDALESDGYYSGNYDISSSSCSFSPGESTYYTGNKIVYEATVYPECSDTKLNIAHDVVSDLIETTEGVNFGVMRFNFTDGGKFITQKVDGEYFTSTIKDMDEDHTDDYTNRDALIEVVNDIEAEDWTPLGETLYEALQYFEGDSSYFNTGTYTSPIEASCQYNYVIIITDGMATRDSSVPLNSLCGGDCDGDGNSNDDDDDALDDVAYYLYHNDLSDDFDGTQNVITYPIGFGLDGGDDDAVQLFQDTADNGQGAAEGEGEYYSASDAESLSDALTTIISDVLDTNSAFVAPVVPSSPENRIDSGDRVYFGFFYPETGGNWLGNLKKFGLNDDGEVVDANDDIATDDDGEFLDSAVSYWGSDADGGEVDEGGVGQIMAERDLATDPRNIYTYTGSSTDLTDDSNAFSSTNSALTYSTFDVDSDSEKEAIINYIQGYDSYDEDIDGDTEEQREWPLADILHSSPAIQIYQSFSEENESDTAYNKSIIYVGSNDGQIHAFWDATGEELWSFIPFEMLPNLQNLPDNDIHEYYIDSSPVLISYDYDGDGNIGTGPESSTDDSDADGYANDGSNDKVILLFGLRRGGGINTLSATESRGAYYALDVTDPENPEFMWCMDNTTDSDNDGIADYAELGETWSEPTHGKVRYDGLTRIVAFIGAGYDNNEDLRFGDTQTFPDDTDTATDTTTSTSDAGDVTSDGTSSQVNPRGRGIYMIELGYYSSTTGLVEFHDSPVKLWEYVYDSSRSTNNPEYSFPTGLVAHDSDSDGYIDRLYGGDTGGNMWRFDIASKTNQDAWSAQIIFSANPSDSTNSESGDSATNGRKIFYRPDIVDESNYTGLYFGSGDRAHPQNQAVIDRLYAFYDRDDGTTQTEAMMVNVTDDTLQSSDAAGLTTSSECTITSSSAYCVLQNLYSSEYYGWFIKLDEDEGEKVLAYPSVYNGVAYFTTYVPEMDSDDPCLSSSLGESWLYAVDYKTGEAVFNYDDSNDTTETDNTRATGSDGEVLLRSDRRLSVGSGMATNSTFFTSDDDSSGLLGAGGGVTTVETIDASTTYPIYWLMD